MRPLFHHEGGFLIDSELTLEDRGLASAVATDISKLQLD